MNHAEIELLLKPLANRRRLAILHFLSKRKEANVGEIADMIRLSFTATSRHLAILEGTGFLEKEQRSLNVYYRIGGKASSVLRAVLSLY